MDIQAALKFGQQQLANASLLNSDTLVLDVELILLQCIAKPRTILFTDPHYLLTQTQIEQFQILLNRRAQGEPVAYIVGHRGFWDLDLAVSPTTLIPRPDTESLIDWVLENKLQPSSILDLGTGTGALALALAREFPKAQVLGVDFIEDAVQLAQSNQQRNGIQNAQFKQSNWFENVEGCFDLIVSNPPYIDEDDEHLSQGDVRFEPKSALIASQKGLADLMHISHCAQAYLTHGGCLLMEHGWQQAQAVQTILMQDQYVDVGSGKDLGGNLRFTYGFKA